MADNKQFMDLVKGSFPSDEDLQKTKAGRKSAIQGLREKGLPDIFASAAESVSDAVTPDTREQYMEDMATSVGSVGRPSGKAMSIADETIRKEWNLLSGEARDAFKNSFNAFKSDFLENQANKTKGAAKELFENEMGMVKSSPADAPALQYSGAQSKEARRMLDPSKKFETTSKAIDPEILKMAGNPNTTARPASGLISDKPVVQRAVFPETEAMTHQEKMSLARKFRERGVK